ncbi:MAG: pyridoxine 5'-phosphate synthase [Planctomycetota bacterium]
MILLGVNIDHVATVREARQTYEPDPVWAAAEAELGGADLITCHLRQDRRHVRDRDLRLLRETTAVELNLEMSMEEEIVDIAVETAPPKATLVPERRREVTTEGGLDVAAETERVSDVVEKLQDNGARVSLFIDPDPEQIEASASAGAEEVELHTGPYAEADGREESEQCLRTLGRAAGKARKMDLVVNAGHGLTYRNVGPVVERLLPRELHIGHSIVSRSIFSGMQQAVRRMKDLIDRAESRAD